MDNVIYINGQQLIIPAEIADELQCRFGPDWKEPNILLFWLLEKELRRLAGF